MIEATVLDSNGLSMDEGDVIQVTYPNEKLVSIGTILWNEKDLQIMVHFGDDGFEPLSPMRRYCKVECIGSIKSNSKFALYIAKHKFKNGKEAARFIDEMNADLLGLPVEEKKRKVRAIGNGVKGSKVAKMLWSAIMCIVSLACTAQGIKTGTWHLNEYIITRPNDSTQIEDYQGALDTLYVTWVSPYQYLLSKSGRCTLTVMVHKVTRYGYNGVITDGAKRKKFEMIKIRQ